MTAPTQPRTAGRSISEDLDRTPWGRELPWPAIDTLSGYLVRRTLPTSEAVFREGDTGLFLCVLVEGTVEISKATPGGPRPLARFAAGKTFGEQALLDGQPRSATATAMEPSVVLVLDSQRFGEIELRHPRLVISILRVLARMLSDRLRLTSGKLIETL
jgi:CRP-like cAMP-binding protein